MSKVSGSDSKNTLYCSFCGKSQHEVRKLIAGPTVFICDECVELCMDIIREENKSSLVKSRDGVPTPTEICNVLDDYVIGQRHAEDIIKMKRRLNEIYVKHTGQGMETIERTLDRDYFMTASEAKDFGLIDKVLTDRAALDAEVNKDAAKA